jgi:prepilin-type processing-associated H-X9-DG protein
MLKRFFTSYWSIPVVFVGVPGFGFLMLLLNAYFFGGGERLSPRAQCQVNLKQIALGMMMYSQDYDGKLPPAIFGDKTVGWANGLQPYLKSHQIFQCPADQNERQDNPDLPGFTDYWMNRNAVSVDLNKIDGEQTKMILMGDGDGGSPGSTASYAINRLPASWRKLDKSPAKRHLGGANYAFLDGHVKWFKPDGIRNVTNSLNAGVNTFSIR